MTDIKAIADAQKRFDSAMAEIGGCSDGYCVILRPKGMKTNGGCHCYNDRYKMRRFSQHAAALARVVRAHILQEQSNG